MGTCIWLLQLISLFVVSYSYNNGIGRKPAMGWNTWCSVGVCETDICNEDMILEASQAMISNGMYEVGWNRIHISDCWDACSRTSDGYLQADPQRFPNGIKYINDIIHGYGLLTGIYTSAGNSTCSSGGRKNCTPPGSYGYYAQDAQTFADWAVDYIKIDWCGANCNNAEKQHTQFSNALNATGRPIWLELCRGYGFPPPAYVANVSQSWRITGDHQDMWYGSMGAKHAIDASINNTKMSMSYNWAYNDYLMTGGQGCKGVTDPNVTYPHCPGMTDLEYITEFSMWSIIGSPLIVASDIRNMTDIMKKILLNKEVIDVNQVYEYPGGSIINNLTVNCDRNVTNACQIWYRQIAANSVGVVLYNSGEDVHNITVVFDQIPNMKWNDKIDLSLRDLWEHQEMGYWVDKYTNEIQPHGVQFITVAKQ